jgi:hypothetical protein
VNAPRPPAAGGPRGPRRPGAAAGVLPFRRPYRRPEYLDPATTPPPTVVGPGDEPYPDALAGRWEEHEWPVVTPAAPAALALRGCEVDDEGKPTPLVVRGSDGRWNVRSAGLAAFTARVEAAGFRTARGSGASRPTVPLAAVVGALTERLNAYTWYHPDATPPLTGVLAEVLDDALASPRWDLSEGEERPALPGETYEALGFRVRSRGGPRHGAVAVEKVDWGHRVRRSQDWIDRAVAATGRTTPYRLRPLVVGTANAAGRERLYPAWGVYDAPAAWDGPPGALLAIYGQAVGTGFDRWHTADLASWRDEVPAWRRDPRFHGVRWNGNDIARWARIHCAMTGALLYEFGTARSAATNTDAATCVPRVPAFPEGRDYDVAIAAALTAEPERQT